MTLLCRKHEQIACDDLLIKDLDDPQLVELIRERKYCPPERDHVERAIRFARQVQTDSLIVHCAQGVSRSPAIAWCILFDQLGSHSAATEAVFQMRPQAVPNDVIIRWGVEILTGNGELLSEVFREMYKGERTFGGV